MNINRTLVIAAAACIALAGCTKKNVKEGPAENLQGPPSANTQPMGPSTGGKYTPADLETDSCLRQRVVYFDFDKDAVKPEFQAIVACHAKYLMDRPMAHMRLEGNTDERGSRQYNLGLGERRGDAVMAAIRGNGGSSSQMDVVSYGEEKPVCTESNEECWSKNRRVEIVYTAK
ncbi:MAG: peptidoglycan-associated lipoprotein Pal [Proteobacteria bacterium]|nr:peptidoglycan-associated lipoprotein Pal [Pseudomonadota bacterium]MBS0461315.1 peptidoglycan-associated lipoprotein Pal [Pseudomonadota bacterium]MBS0464518.1 peptidoglycan-associated lipoprotein Pal [Pseudomonadota bacterium]